MTNQPTVQPNDQLMKTSVNSLESYTFKNLRIYSSCLGHVLISLNEQTPLTRQCNATAGYFPCMIKGDLGRAQQDTW